MSKIHSLSRLAHTTFKELQTGRSISSKEVFDRDAKYVAHNYAPVPVALAKGEGIYVWDVEGKKYMDFLSGYSANNFGHCHPKMVEISRQQVGILHHISRAFYSEILGEYGEMITKIFEYDQVVPMNTGVEASDTSVKVARKWGYRKKNIPNNEAKVVFCRDNFWGRSIAAVSASTDPESYEGFGPYVPNFCIVPFNDLKALENILADPHVCGFMLEPIQGEAGIIIPSDGYLRGARELCTKHNVLLIADEIQTGLGRTGKRIACDHECIMPDLLVLGKSLGGGVYPVSCVLGNNNVMDVLDPGTHGSTFGGNPLACKCAMTALKILEEEKLADNAREMGELLRCGLNELKGSGIVQEVRGRGLLNAITIDSNKANIWDFLLKLRDNGIITKNTHENIIRLQPPLIINECQIYEAVDIFTKTLKSFERKEKAQKEKC